MSAGDGVVDYAGTNGSYGLYVRIRHDGKHETAYAHLSRLLPGTRIGKRVSQGQTIAYSGSTGRSTGPHLHYEVLVNEEQVNPMSVKFQAGRKLAGKELVRFKALEKQEAGWLVQTPVTSRTASR
jgi:murein DD-endopeptidase MepM/ murein hydrolase activator NlpD